MKTWKYLGAYTPAQGYHTYPPFVNISECDEKIRIMLRTRETYNQNDGYHHCGEVVEVEFSRADIKVMLEEIVGKLNNGD